MRIQASRVIPPRLISFVFVGILKVGEGVCTGQSRPVLEHWVPIRCQFLRSSATPRRRRALALLAASRDGCTEAVMLAHGFTIPLMGDRRQPSDRVADFHSARAAA
jgi:hypothetical protein